MKTKNLILKNDNELFMFIKNNIDKKIHNRVINDFVKKFDWYCYNQFKSNTTIINDFFEFYRYY